MKVLQTEKEMLEHLKNQIRFLENSAQLYDEGVEGEAMRMALGIRLLVHDTSNSKSLLKQLNKKDVLFYDSTLDFDPNYLVSHICGLAGMKVGTRSGAKFFPFLDDLPSHRLNKKVPFNDWWYKIVIVDNNRNQFTRKSLVINVANTDGGAHIDPSLDKEYADLSRLKSIGWKIIMSGVEASFRNRPELACIRQITHELLKTLKDEFPEYF